DGDRDGGGLADGKRAGEFAELACGVPAAGGTSGEVCFVAGGDGLAVGPAEIAALAAVELRHGGHELPGGRLIGGEVHALVEREGGVVPRVVVIIGRRRGGRWRRGGGRACLRVQQAGEKAG